MVLWELSRTAGAPRRPTYGLRIVPCVAGWLVLHLVALEIPVAAQEGSGTGTPPVFTTLEGRWTGAGELMGRPADFEMHWEIDTEGFVRLFFKNAWVSGDGSVTPVLSSVATYYPSGASALGVWLDDRPQRLTLDAVLTDSTVTTYWAGDAEKGRTEYRVRSSGAVVVRDFVYVDGSERLFAEATYSRVPRAPS